MDPSSAVVHSPGHGPGYGTTVGMAGKSTGCGCPHRWLPLANCQRQVRPDGILFADGDSFLCSLFAMRTCSGQHLNRWVTRPGWRLPPEKPHGQACQTVAKVPQYRFVDTVEEQ